MEFNQEWKMNSPFRMNNNKRKLGKLKKRWNQKIIICLKWLFWWNAHVVPSNPCRGFNDCFWVMTFLCCSITLYMCLKIPFVLTFNKTCDRYNFQFTCFILSFYKHTHVHTQYLYSKCWEHVDLHQLIKVLWQHL